MNRCKTVPFIILLSLFFLVTFSFYDYIQFHNARVCKFYENNSQARLDIFHSASTKVSSKLQESRSQNSENNCKDCTRNVPNVIIQYGPGRTATTLQFQILCAMMAMLHENNSNSVGCYFHKKPAHNFTVIKTHSIDFLLESLPQNAWIFMTAGTREPNKHVEAKQHIEQHNRTVRLTVDTDMVSKRGHFIAYEYQSIFGISDTQMTSIVTYLRYWDILRRCCGKQMSTDWRNYLSPIPNYTQHYNPDDISYPACEMYNISKVEELFIKTIMYKRFTSVKSLRDTIGKPSTVDKTLDGNYCAKCNKNIAKRGLHGLNNDCS